MGFFLFVCLFVCLFVTAKFRSIESILKRKVTLQAIFTGIRSDGGLRSPLATGNGRALRRWDRTTGQQQVACVFPRRPNSTMCRLNSISGRWVSDAWEAEEIKIKYREKKIHLRFRFEIRRWSYFQFTIRLASTTVSGTACRKHQVSQLPAASCFSGDVSTQHSCPISTVQHTLLPLSCAASPVICH